MSIRYFSEKIKWSDVFGLGVSILCTCFIFLFIKLIVLENQKGNPIIFEPLNQEEIIRANQDSGSDYKQLLASKNGQFYYYPGCSRAKLINVANRITFHSTEEAERAGFLPAKGCLPQK